MYAHTETEPAHGIGISLEKLTLATGCPLDRVKFPPASVWHLGAPAALVANLYQAFDVLLNPSMGEGFGIPILEAQACGVPVIASDHSAMTELTQAGWLVTGDPWWDALQDSFLIVPPDRLDPRGTRGRLPGPRRPEAPRRRRRVRRPLRRRPGHASLLGAGIGGARPAP